MKVAFLCHNIFTDGGVQVSVTKIANYLTEIGYEVNVICTAEKLNITREKYNLNNKIKVNHVPRRKESCFCEFARKILRGINKYTGCINNKYTVKILERAYYRKTELQDIAKYINHNKYDIVIGCEGFYSVFLGIIANKISSRTIGWQHSSFEAYFISNNKYYGNREYLFSYYLKNLNANLVLTYKDKVKYQEKLLINSTVMYNPLTFTSLEKSNQNNYRLIACGRLVYQKGFDLLIEAFSIANSKLNKEIDLVILGSGEEENKLREMIKEFRIEDRVKIISFTNKVKEYMINSDLYIMSSRNEGFGLVVIEALECGLPIITFDTSGPVEIIDGYNCGVIVNNGDIKKLADAIIELVENRIKREEYSLNAIKRAKDFNKDKIIMKWNLLMQNLEENKKYE